MTSEAAVRSGCLGCSACTQADLDSESFRSWALRLGERPGHLHRKVWEWCFIVQALHERGMLTPGSRGLGFAVGREPLAALFASLGCEILGTDLGRALAETEGWVAGNQHAEDLQQLNQRGLCNAQEFSERVRFAVVDMREIPDDLGTFDFLWSSCAMEHLGGLREGRDFVVNAMKLLRPGGIAVHTTEFNCDSNEHTITSGNNVLFRKRDLLELSDDLARAGHLCMPFDFRTGDSAADQHVDEIPYKGPLHLKLRIGPYASTSFGLIIKAGER